MKQCVSVGSFFLYTHTVQFLSIHLELWNKKEIKYKIMNIDAVNVAIDYRAILHDVIKSLK